jgi:hypothetical protein
MKRLLAIATSLAILAALPATATAARPTRFTDHTVGIFCEGLTATSGGGFAFFSATVSDQFGPDAFVDFWTTSEPTGNPDLFRDFEQPVDVDWNGSVLAGSIPLLDSDGDPAGAATFSATLVPSGDPFAFDDTFRDGNRQHRFTGVSQPMDPTGSLLVGGSTFSLDECFADETTITVFETNPRSFVTHFSNRDVGCELSNAAGDTGFLFTSLEEGEVFIDAAVFPADGSAGTGAFGSGVLTDGILDATLDAFDFETGEPAVGGASIHLEIVGSGEPFEFVIKNATFRLTARGVTLDLEGTLTIGTSVFDLGACVGVDGRTKLIDTFPSGPKPGGKVPSNDLPSGAKLLAAGERTSVATKGASPEREASYECLTFDFDGEVFEVPVGHTVWYRIVGTGDPVTVDTAGSDFDTVIAVYTADGAGGFTPVPDACVDDVPVEPIGATLQAAVTFDTVAGTTYYVQIGGFPQSFPYGNLRVAVR